MYVQINEQVFVSTLSKGAKLLYGALGRLPCHDTNYAQLNLDLGEELPATRLIAYQPAELATYMRCGVASVRRYAKELITAGWASWHRGQERGRNRQLVLRLDTGGKSLELQAAEQKVSRSSRRRAKTEEAKPTQLEAFETTLPSMPLKAMPTLLQEIADPEDQEKLYIEMRVATAKVAKRVLARGLLPLEYALMPLTMEDLQTLWASWDAHDPALPDAGIDQHLQSHMDAVKLSQEPYCEMRVGKMLHLYKGALSLHRELMPVIEPKRAFA